MLPNLSVGNRESLGGFLLRTWVLEGTLQDIPQVEVFCFFGFFLGGREMFFTKITFSCVDGQFINTELPNFMTTPIDERELQIYTVSNRWGEMVFFKRKSISGLQLQVASHAPPHALPWPSTVARPERMPGFPA